MRQKHEIEQEIESIRANITQLYHRRDDLTPREFRKLQGHLLGRIEKLNQELRDNWYVDVELIDSIGNERTLTDIINEATEVLLKNNRLVDFDKIIINANKRYIDDDDTEEYLSISYKPYTE